MSHDAANPQSGFNWDDPHHFHHGADDQDHGDHHHTSSWQLLVSILFALLFFTALTVFSAEAERWLIGLGVHFSHFWNVVVALSIALVKATLVCMFFMHLKNDNPLNTMILLTTLFVFGLFIMFTGIDLYERGRINEFKADYLEAGGTGTGIRKGSAFSMGPTIGDPITWYVKQQRIETYANEFAQANDHLDGEGQPEPTEDDLFAAQDKFWSDFYHHKFEDHPEHLPVQHHRDRSNDDPTQGMLQREAIYPIWLAHHIETHGQHEVSDASRSIPRHGRTPNLFGDGTHGHDGGHDTHGEHPAHDSHADDHSDPHPDAHDGGDH